MTEHVKVEEASREELFAFAKNILQLDIDGRATKDTLLQKISAAGWKKPTIPSLVSVNNPPPVHDDGLPMPYKVETVRVNDISNKNAGERTRRYFALRIETNDGPGGKEPVSVSVNGRGIYIPRGVPVAVAEEYVEVLQNAVQLSYPENKDVGPHDSGGLKNPTEVPRYPFSFVPHNQVKPENVMNHKG